jgi:hypothetical protein
MACPKVGVAELVRLVDDDQIPRHGTDIGPHPAGEIDRGDHHGIGQERLGIAFLLKEPIRPGIQNGRGKVELLL